MSQVVHSSDMEGLYGTLYELVTPMMATDNCVKCITQDGGTTFTSDVTNLMSNLDIEHPAGELVVQALQSHKCTYGTGTNTLLFMLASIAKAVTQLYKLGVPSETSMHVIRDALADLSQDVQEIAVVVERDFNSTQQKDNLRGKTINRETGKTLPANGLDDAKSCGKTDVSKTLKLNHLVKARSKLVQGKQEISNVNNIMALNFTMQNNLLAQDGKSNLQSYMSADSTSRNLKATSNNHHTEENYKTSSTSELKFFITDHKISEVIYPSLEKTIDYSAGSIYKEVAHSSAGDVNKEVICTLLPANTDPVTLKMTDLQNVCDSTKDISWFFDSHPSFSTEDEKLVDHVSHPVKEFSTSLQDTVLNSKHCVEHLVSCGGESNLITVNTGALSFRGSRVNENDHLSDEEVSFLGGGNLEESISEINQGEIINNSTVHFSGCEGVIRSSALFDDTDNHHFAGVIVVNNCKPLPSESQKYKKHDDGDFEDCFSDFDVYDSSLPHSSDVEVSLFSNENSENIFNVTNLCNKPKAFPEKELNHGVSVPTKNFSECVIQNSEIDKLNAMLNCLGINRTQINLSTSSRHLRNIHTNSLESSSNDNLSSVGKCHNVSQNLLSQTERVNTQRFGNNDKENLCNHGWNTNVNNTGFIRDNICDNIEQLSDIISAPPALMSRNSDTVTSATQDLISRNSDKVTSASQDLLSKNSDKVTSASQDLLSRNFDKVNLTKTAEVKHTRNSVCSNWTEMGSCLSRKRETFCCFAKLQTIIYNLHDCHGDLAEAAQYIFQKQMKEQNKKRFNFNLVDCLPISSASLPPSLHSAWKSSTSPLSVVSGLVIPCDRHVLQQLDIAGKSLATLLICGDLTTTYHHKGYKPTLAKRTFIAKPYSESQESDARTWYNIVFDIINQLKVNLILVKGEASSILMDMCDAANIVIVSNIRHHTLSVLSHQLNVNVLNYITQATQESLCTLCLQPLSTAWMDQLDQTHFTTEHYAIVTNASDVQCKVHHSRWTYNFHI